MSFFDYSILDNASLGKRLLRKYISRIFINMDYVKENFIISTMASCVLTEAKTLREDEARELLINIQPTESSTKLLATNCKNRWIEFFLCFSRKVGTEESFRLIGVDEEEERIAFIYMNILGLNLENTNPDDVVESEENQNKNLMYRACGICGGFYSKSGTYSHTEPPNFVVGVLLPYFKIGGQGLYTENHFYRIYIYVDANDGNLYLFSEAENYNFTLVGRIFISNEMPIVPTTAESKILTDYNEISKRKYYYPQESWKKISPKVYKRKK